jgi:hypothetical protein
MKPIVGPTRDLPEPSDEEVRLAAAEGMRTPAVALPYLDRIQASFGRHSVGHVKAHVGAEAAQASWAMSAQAFASRNHVVFGGTPDLRTAAHEAAHIVQQRVGVQSTGGTGREGDVYERYADAAAEAVMAGRSAQELLEPFASPSPAVGETSTSAGESVTETRRATPGGVASVRQLPRPLMTAPAVQRKIDYSTRSKRLGEIQDQENLIDVIASSFPWLKRERIIQDINQIEEKGASWSLSNVYDHFNNLADETPSLAPISDADLNSDVRLPAKLQERLDFGFTPRTRLSATIKQGDRPLVLPRSYTQTNSKQHAEDNLIAALNGLIARREVNPEEDTIVITINNSPCQRCAERLAEWKQTNWPGEMVIHFANPYGSGSDYIKARGKLRENDIEVHSFDPLHYIKDRLEPSQQDKFRSIKRRRKKSRSAWNEEHPSDLSSDTDDEPERERKVKRAKQERIEQIEQGSEQSMEEEGPDPGNLALTLKEKELNFLIDVNNCLIKAMNGGTDASLGQRVAIRNSLQPRGGGAGKQLPATKDVLETIAGHLGIKNRKIVVSYLNNPLSHIPDVFYIDGESKVQVAEIDTEDTMEITFKNNHFEFLSLDHEEENP